MYYELGEFLYHMARRHRLWKDGEFWTAVVIGGFAGVLFYRNPAAVKALRDRFGEFLTVASIVFGFVLTTLVFYVQTATEWSKDARIDQVADKLVDWHIWTIFCLLFLVWLIVIVWLCKDFFLATKCRAAASHGGIVFLATYSSFQILNHILTVRWVFRKRSVLKDRSKNEGV